MTGDGALKPGWRRVKFGDVVRLSKARSQNPLEDGYDRYVGLEHLEPGDLRVRSWGNVADGTTFTNVFKPGQVLFGKRRAYQRKVAVAGFSGVCSGDIYVFESKEADRLLPDFLPFICQSEGFFEHAISTSAGSLSPRTNWDSLKEFSCLLPPLEKQEELVRLFISIDESIEEFRSLSAKSHELWRVRTLEIFENAPKKLNLEDLISYSSDGPFGSKLKTEHYSDNGARVIRLNNIEALKFSDRDKAFIPLEYYDTLKSYSVLAGDVIIAGLGDESIPMGRSCIVPQDLGLAINKADCFCVRPKEGLDPMYLVHYLNSDSGMRQAQSKSQGSTRRRLNLENIRKLAIPIYASRDQVKFSKELNSYIEAESMAESRIKQLSNFRRNFSLSILQGAS